MTNFADFIGVNTHLDFNWTAYKNVPLVIQCLQFLGVKHVRDSANNPANVTAGLWKQVADATGVKFNAYIGSGSPQVMTDGLKLIQSLAPQGILESIEGGNEEDNSYAVANGNTALKAATFQRNVFIAGRNLKLPVINISFGAGWDKPTGDYGTVGDLSNYCDYANAHTYPGVSGDPVKTVDFVNGLTQLAAKKPVITTEIGWYTGTMPGGVTEQEQADKLVAAFMECQKTGNFRAYVYELLDQNTGDSNPENNFGLFHSDGTPKPAAAAIRNLILSGGTVSAPVPAPVIAAPIINADGSITDPYAATASGKMTLNLSVAGTLSEINGLLSQWKGGMTVDIWNQAGKNATRTIVRG